MREVVCGFLNSHKVVVNTLTGEATLLDDCGGNLTIIGVLVESPIDHSNDKICEQLTTNWNINGVIMSTKYFVKFTESEAQYYSIECMDVPFFTTAYELERLSD